MINRSIMILKYKTPAVQWINEAAPADENPGITAAEINADRTVYLVSDELGESPEVTRGWVELNMEALFANELNGWYTDEGLWPADRTQTLFDEWFEVEFHSIIVDTLDSAIEDVE